MLVKFLLGIPEDFCPHRFFLYENGQLDCELSRFWQIFGPRFQNRHPPKCFAWGTSRNLQILMTLSSEKTAPGSISKYSLTPSPPIFGVICPALRLVRRFRSLRRLGLVRHAARAWFLPPARKPQEGARKRSRRAHPNPRWLLREV